MAGTGVPPTGLISMLRPKRFYGKGIPGIALDQLKGELIVVEGADGSGRSTQIDLLRNWLERRGYPTVNVGLKRSMLVSRELERAMSGNVLGTRTLSLFYATDFADQLENVMIPALRSGFIVLADRYIYTLMSRAIVRGVLRAFEFEHPPTKKEAAHAAHRHARVALFLAVGAIPPAPVLVL